TITNMISAPAGLTINGNLNNLEGTTGRNFTLSGTGNINFNGTLTGTNGAAAGLVVNMLGTLTIGGAVTADAQYTNGTTINEGTVIVSRAGSLNPFGTANVLAFGGGTLQSTVTLTGSDALVTPLQLTNSFGVIAGTNSIEFAGNGTQNYSLQNNGGNRTVTN